MTLLLSFLIFLLLIAAMAVGVIFANKPIKGSCGGLSNVGLQSACMICGGSNQADSADNEKQDNEQYYNAASNS